jgi:hypothetical protein
MTAIVRSETTILARIILVLVMLSSASPALALDACFAASVGPWRGPVWNRIGIETMETEFQAGPDETLTGRYRILDAVPFEGTLSGFRQTGTCEADFTWTDRDGTGTVHIRFEPQLGRFIGGWGGAVPVPDLVFNGYRFGPEVVS